MNQALKMYPIFNEEGNEIVAVEIWVNCAKVTRKVTMVYRPDLQCSIAFANASTEYVRARTMSNNGKEMLLISLKQSNEVLLPRGVDFKLDVFVWKDEEGNQRELPYKILVLEEDL